MAKQGKNEAVKNTDLDNNVDLTVGNVNEADLLAMGFEEVDPLKGLDATYNAGQDGFMKGTTKLGVYKGTKVCISTRAKKPRWKLCDGANPKDPAARVYRKLHIFQAARPDGEVLKTFYGLWQAGTLSAALERIEREQLLAVTYLGQSETPFREGDTPPHLFKIIGKGIKIQMTDLADIESDIEGSEDLSPVQAGIGQSTGQQAAAAH